MAAKEKTQAEHFETLELIALIGVKDILDVKEVAVYIRRTENRVRHLVSESMIPYYTKPGGRITFKKSEIDDWLLGTRVQTKEEIEQEAATYLATAKYRKR